jgi:hypothetical protein
MGMIERMGSQFNQNSPQMDSLTPQVPEPSFGSVPSSTLYNPVTDDPNETNGLPSALGAEPQPIGMQGGGFEGEPVLNGAPPTEDMRKQMFDVLSRRAKERYDRSEEYQQKALNIPQR